jgi:hypothetical protein
MIIGAINIPRFGFSQAFHPIKRVCSFVVACGNGRHSNLRSQRIVVVLGVEND